MLSFGARKLTSAEICRQNTLGDRCSSGRTFPLRPAQRRSCDVWRARHSVIQLVRSRLNQPSISAGKWNRFGSLWDKCAKKAAGANSKALQIAKNSIKSTRRSHFSILPTNEGGFLSRLASSRCVMPAFFRANTISSTKILYSGAWSGDKRGSARLKPRC